MGLKPRFGGRTAQGSMQNKSMDLANVATISIDGQVLALHSWSMSGFRCGGYTGYLRPGLTTKVRIMIPSGDRRHSFELTAEIEQRDIESGMISGSFTGLSAAQLEGMDAIFARRLSGRHRPS